MKKPKRKKARFSVGQIVRSLIDDGIGRILSKPWLTTLDGHIPEAYSYDLDNGERLIEYEIRPLRQRERGQ